MHVRVSSKRRTILFSVFLVLAAVRCNVFEFVISPNEEVCFQEMFQKDQTPSLRFQAYKLNKDTQSEELSDLTKAGVIDKRKGSVKLSLKVESVSGIVYTVISKSEQVKNFKAKETELVNMCFKNPEKAMTFVIFDLRIGAYANDVSSIPTSEDVDGVMEKLDGIRARLDNSLSLYMQMETYEQQHLQASNTVLSGVVLIGQITIAAIALVGWGITLLVEKSLKNKKSS